MIEFKTFYRDKLGISGPYSHQQELWDGLLSNKQEPSVFLVKAPTGSGKTEAVIAPFLAQFQENRFTIAPRLIYVLPMRVLANQVADRIRSYAQRISPDISVKIQHGDVPQAPFFIADIVVTTLDQFLYGFARASQQVGRHIDIPAGAIASSLVVFDEAHMYRDEFTFAIMRALMEILHRSRVPFVVMTATMPETLQKSLFENINLPPEQIIKGETAISSNLTIQIADAPLFANGRVNLDDEIIKKITTHKTLIILNQVKRAQMVYDEIKGRLGLDDQQIVLLHSRFTREDRKAHEEQALSMIPHKNGGKLVVPPGDAVVVATQVLEAGIDFSAEILLTELAPADSLIQRAGRCARYKGESGELIIFPVEEENKGYLPYEKESLLNTLEWLQKNKNKFNIKDFNEVCSFVDETLDYRACDYEAGDTLIDLYECVLYADARPANIQLRKGKPITLVVVDLSRGEGRKKEVRMRDAIKKTNIQNNSISVDFGVGWKLLKDGILKYRLDFNEEKGEWDFKEIKEIYSYPFGYYLLEANNYDRVKGVIPDACSFII